MANAIFSEPGLYEGVVKRFADRPYVVIHRGFLPESLEQNSPERISLLHLDLGSGVNSTKPEIACLELLFDRIVPGGMVVFDDYGWRTYGQQKAAQDSFFAERGYKILELPTGQGLLVKRA